MNKIKAFLSLKPEHNDNIFYTSDGEKVDDFIITASPKLTFARSDDRLVSSFSGKLNIIDYYEKNELDAVDDEYRASLGYKLTQRLSFKGEGQYLKNSRPDYFVDETGLTTAKKIEKTVGSFNGDYILTESSLLSAGYNHENFQYRESDKQGTETNSANFMIGKDLSGSISNMSSRFSLGYSNSSSADLEIYLMSSTIGITKAINETVSLSIDTGISNIKTNFDNFFIIFNPDPTLVDLDDEYLEWLFFSSIDYKGEYTSLSISLSRTVVPAPERSGAVERLSSGLSCERRLSEDLSIFTSILFHKNNSDKGQFSTAEIDEELIQLRPGLKYKINRYLNFEAAYRYSFSRNKTTDKDATQNIFYLNLWSDYPIFE